MKAKFFIFFFILFAKILSIKILEKYGSTTIICKSPGEDGYENAIALDSSGFDLKEDIFFTFKLEGRTTDMTSQIKYKFEDNVNRDEISTNYYSQLSKTKDSSSDSQSQVMNKYTYKHYYTINKEEDKKYLLIGFDCTSGELTIENTKEDDGNKEMIIIIVVFVVFFVIIIVITVICCIRRRKARAARMAMRMQMASGAYYPPPGMGMGMSVGVGMPPAYGGNYMMNNMPPQPNMMGSQPVAYSRMPNDATQIEPNAQNPDEIPQPNSGMRIKKTKV